MLPPLGGIVVAGGSCNCLLTESKPDYAMKLIRLLLLFAHMVGDEKKYYASLVLEGVEAGQDAKWVRLGPPLASRSL